MSQLQYDLNSHKEYLNKNAQEYRQKIQDDLNILHRLTDIRLRLDTMRDAREKALRESMNKTRQVFYP